MVTERTFRSVKIIIRVKLDPRYTELRKPEYDQLQRPDPLTIVQDPAVMCRVIREAFSEYNSAPHTANYGASPNTTQDALIVSLLQENGQFPEVQFSMDDNNNAENTFFKLDGQKIPVLAQQVPSQELLAAMRFRTQALTLHTQLPLVKRFDNFRADTDQSFNNLARQNKILIDQNLAMEKTLDFLKGCFATKATKEKREQQELRKSNRDQAPVRPPCDTVSFDEFIELIESKLLKNSYNSMRVKAALIIMYFTGLRLSSLLSFKVINFQEMLSTTSHTIIDGKKILISPYLW